MSENQTRNNRPLIIALIAIALLLICCCLVLAGLAFSGVLTWSWADVFVPRVEATERIEHTFGVSTPASLVVDVNVGDVVIQAGDGDEVRVEAVKHAWGRDRHQAEHYLNDFEVRLGQTANRVEIEAKTPHKLRSVGRTPTVELEITVPRETNLDLVINVGKVEVTGVRGAFDIESNVSDVTLRGVYFAEDSRIKSDVGSVELRLPADSAFTFTARSNVGEVRVGFPIRHERSEKSIVGASVEGEIGGSPTAYVELQTNTGSIRIRQK